MKQRTRQWLKENGKPVGRHQQWDGEKWELGSPGPADQPNRKQRREYFIPAMAQYVRGSGIKRRRRKLGKEFRPRRMDVV